MCKPGPIVVGATGGSGTRAMHALLGRAGVDMGRRLNQAGDAMDFEPFLDAFINRILGATRRLDYVLGDLPQPLRSEVLTAFERALATYRADIEPNAIWGWKNGRSMFVLPVIHGAVHDFRFIHLVRDGRDMALSSNQNQARKHYAALFGREPAASMEVSAAQLWATANLQVARWAERNLGHHYIRLRFEDLCADPAGVVRSLVDRLDSPESDIETIARGVKAPQTIERWRQAPPSLIAEITEAAEPGLARFGYIGG